jgi:hypothetical protein
MGAVPPKPSLVCYGWPIENTKTTFGGTPSMKEGQMKNSDIFSA